MDNRELYLKLQEAVFTLGESIYRVSPVKKSNVIYKTQFSLLLEEYKKIITNLSEDLFSNQNASKFNTTKEEIIQFIQRVNSVYEKFINHNCPIQSDISNTD